MTQLNFPSNPTNGQLYPDPALPNVAQFSWSTSKGAWLKVKTIIEPASETEAGIAELATQNEVDEGEDDLRIVTPATLTGFLEATSFNNKVTEITQGLGLGSILVVSSSDPHTIGTGSKVFNYVSAAPADFYVGQRLQALYTAIIYMEGVVTSITSSSVTLLIDFAEGSGTYSAWTVGISSRSVVPASETVAGIAEIATQDEVDEGRDDTSIVTPAKLKTNLDAKLVNLVAVSPSLLVITSSSSNSISTGSKTFAFEPSTSLGFFVGQHLRAVSDVNNYMDGIVTELTENSVTINIDYFIGNGTYNNWTIGITGSSSSTSSSIVQSEIITNLFLSSIEDNLKESIEMNQLIYSLIF